MKDLLLTPPAAFLIVLAVSWLILVTSHFLSCKPNIAEGSRKSYACGEDDYDNMAQPDYSQFFVFAFFFTLAHVAVLIMATVPKSALDVVLLSFLYMVVVVMALVILLKGKGNGTGK